MTIGSSLVSDYKTFVRETFNESWKEAYDLLNGELKHYFPEVSYDFVKREDLLQGGAKVESIPSPIPGYSDFRDGRTFVFTSDTQIRIGGNTVASTVTFIPKITLVKGIDIADAYQP